MCVRGAAASPNELVWSLFWPIWCEIEGSKIFFLTVVGDDRQAQWTVNGYKQTGGAYPFTFATKTQR